MEKIEQLIKDGVITHMDILDYLHKYARQSYKDVISDQIVDDYPQDLFNDEV
jgi:hypothetical protein